MKQRNRLKSSFESVRENFFPKWDKAKKWRAKKVWHLPVMGICCNRLKEIQVRTVFENEDELDRLLIHEICHAVTPGNHPKRWNERMLKASKRADELGRHGLVSLLSKDIEAYKNSFPVKAKDVYGRIEDVVVEIPNITLNGLIRGIAKEFGMYKSELLAKYTQCRKIFNKVKKEVQAEERWRRDFLGKHDQN
ncbi:MAG: hypothetical protein ABSH06_14405 [Thermodesulfobacteriota bacterium]|jgi:hypothetical protein